MTRFADLPMAQQAGMLCNDARFIKFIEAVYKYPGETAGFVRGHCGIKSRKDLNTNTAAQSKFQSLRTDFDAWRGGIAKPH